MHKSRTAGMIDYNPDYESLTERTRYKKKRPFTSAAQRGMERRLSESIEFRNSRGPKFFRNTRVSSCRRIQMKNGKPKAVPFRLSRRCLQYNKNFAKAQKDKDTESIYQ